MVLPIKKKNIEIATLICKILDKIYQIKNKSFLDYIDFVYDRPGHDKRYAINATKIKQLGWKSSINFKKGMLETVKWYLKNEKWWRKIIKNKYTLERLGKEKK